MPERAYARRRKYRWIKILNVMVASLRGGGGGSSALCSNDEPSHISEGEKLLCELLINFNRA